MKSIIYSIKGTKAGDIKIPAQFEEEIREDLIQRSFLAIQSHKRQPYGVNLRAGFKTSARNRGRRSVYGSWANRGMARVARIRVGSGHMAGRVRRVPEAVKGRRAHPPTSEKIWEQKINKKERRKAIRSAIAATSDKSLVEKRNHRIKNVKQLPVIVEDKIELLKKTKDILETLKRLGVGDDLKRTEKKKIRAGKGTMRGRKYKRKKGPLIVISSKALTAAENIQGVDVCNVKNINVDLLAPGAQPGRLTIWTKSAIEQLDKEKLFY